MHSCAVPPFLPTMDIRSCLVSLISFFILWILSYSWYIRIDLGNCIYYIVLSDNLFFCSLRLHRSVTTDLPFLGTIPFEIVQTTAVPAFNSRLILLCFYLLHFVWPRFFFVCIQSILSSYVPVISYDINFFLIFHLVYFRDYSYDTFRQVDIINHYLYLNFSARIAM